MLAVMLGLAVATHVEGEDPVATTRQETSRPQSSKEKLESELGGLKVGVSRCSDIESYLAFRLIQYSVWDHGADGDGTHRYTVVNRHPEDNSLWDDLLDRTLYGTIEVTDCIMRSKKVEYTYTFL